MTRHLGTEEVQHIKKIKRQSLKVFLLGSTEIF